MNNRMTKKRAERKKAIHSEEPSEITSLDIFKGEPFLRYCTQRAILHKTTLKLADIGQYPVCRQLHLTACELEIVCFPKVVDPPSSSHANVHFTIFMFITGCKPSKALSVFVGGTRSARFGGFIKHCEHFDVLSRTSPNKVQQIMAQKLRTR
jgi:hypothetical protein